MTFVDLVPRNRLLGAGYALCGFFLALLTILLSQFENSDNRSAVSSHIKCRHGRTVLTCGLGSLPHVLP